MILTFYSFIFRLRYEEGADFILREYSEREQKVLGRKCTLHVCGYLYKLVSLNMFLSLPEIKTQVDDLKVGRVVWTDQNEIVNHLPVSLMQALIIDPLRFGLMLSRFAITLH